MRNKLKSALLSSLFAKSLLGFFTLYAAFYFSAPFIIKKVATDKLKEEYGVTLSLGSLQIEPLSADIKLKDISLSHPSQKSPFIACSSLDVNIGYYGFLKGAFVLDAVNIDNLALNLSRDENKTLNIQKIFPSKGEQKEPKPFFFSLNNINIKNSSISFADDVTKQKYELKGIELSLPFISNVPYETDIFTAPHFKTIFNGAKFEINGTTRPFAKDLKSEMNVSFDDLNMSLANAFLPKDIPVQHVFGLLSVKSKILFEKSTTNKLHVFADVALKDGGVSSDFGDIAYKNVKVAKINLDAADRNIKISSLDVHGLDVNAKEPKPSAKNGKDEKPKPNDKDWKLSVESLLVDGKLAYKEWVIDDFAIGAKNIQNYKDDPFVVNASLKSKYANLDCNADVGLKTKTAKGVVEIKDAPLSTINQFGVLPQKLKIYGGEVGAVAKFDVRFDSNFSAKIDDAKIDAKNFALYADNRNTKLIGFNTFSFSGINAEYPKNKVNVGGAALSGFYANIKITKDKEINLVKYFDSDKNSTGSKTKQTSSSAKPLDFTLQKFTLYKGRIDFEDRSLKQKFKTSLTDITGGIGKLSLNKNQSAAIDLRANSGGYGRIALRGNVVPQSDNFALNLKAKTVDVPMTQFTPYAEKFMGYKIESGALGLDLDYKILKRQLNSNNKITLLGFNLGDEVDSPDAKRLPYKLALAILKDDKGNIDVELPVEGSLDDPEVRSGQVIWKFIVQLVTKIIKSPFSAIASIFGGGDEYSYAAFGYGSAVLPDAEAAKLKKTAEIINKKPSLKVELRGFIDSEKDVIGYKEESLNKKVAAAKMKDLKLKVPVAVEANEYEKYLKEVYSAEKFPKPKNFLGFTKSLSAKDMKTLIITHTEAGAKELENLARMRAERVREELIKDGVAKERISISTKELGAPEPKEKAPNSRVEITFI